MSLYFARMKSWYKSKINWVGIALILIGLLEFITPGVLESIGIQNPERWASILGLLLVFLRQITTQNTTPILKIGGRPRRDKKPTGLPLYPNMEYSFEGNDFTASSEVTYSLAPSEEEFPVNIILFDNYPNKQIIAFAEKIEFQNIEDLTFYIY